VAVDTEVKEASREVDSGLRLLQSRVRILLAQRERLHKSDRTLQKKVANLHRLVGSCEEVAAAAHPQGPGNPSSPKKAAGP